MLTKYIYTNGAIANVPLTFDEITFFNSIMKYITKS